LLILWAAHTVAVSVTLVLAYTASGLVRQKAATRFERAIDVLMCCVCLCALAPAVAFSLWLGIKLLWGE